MNILYCNNCGNERHLYRHCKLPVLSYGVLLFTHDKKLLMIQRKDSISYIEFLRGKYKSIYDTEYIELLFSRFSKEELEKIDKYDFDTLWNKLWIHTETINPRIKREYKKSKNDFYKLKQGYKKGETTINIKYLINKVNTIYISNEWEIPKGRRKMYENNRACAIREFYEETNVDPSLFKLYKNIIPIVEEYIGINKVRYKHVYYIGIIDKKCELIIDKGNKDQYTEIKDINWCSKEECLKNIREYDETKRTIIINFFEYLENHKNVVTLE